MKTRHIFIICLLSSLVIAAQPNEPQGFRVLIWGAPAASVKDLVGSRIDTDYGMVQFYTKKHENLQVGKAMVEKIEYGFWQNQLSQIEIRFHGIDNLRNLMRYFNQQFSEFRLLDNPTIDFTWPGIVTYGFTYFDIHTQIGVIYLYSLEITEKKAEQISRELYK